MEQSKMTEKKLIFPIYQVDAFSEKPFKGNPAAVCILADDLEDNVLQKIAAEMNLSETAFIYVENFNEIKTKNEFRLRWFTPKVEVKLCGHATLATAAVLFFEYGVELDEIYFETLSGTLSARKVDGSVALNFPITEPKEISSPDELLAALGIKEAVNVSYSEEITDILVELDNHEQIRNLEPDFNKLLDLDLDIEIRGVIVTSKGFKNYDFVSRFFAPWYGINEDPVTGSAHTILTPYWSKKLNKKEMVAYQMSERGGKVIVKLRSDGRVEIIGETTVILRGELSI